MISHEELLDRVTYDPKTGIFTRNHDCHKKSAGDVMGGNHDGYIRISIDNQYYLAHRLAWFYMTGEWPSKLMDHQNHVRDDNRFDNLREVDHAENHKNYTLQSNNTSGVVGVSWRSDTSKWHARIKINGKIITLGCFLHKNNAIKARKEAEIKYNFHENHGVAA